MARNSDAEPQQETKIVSLVSGDFHPACYEYFVLYKCVGYGCVVGKSCQLYKTDKQGGLARSRNDMLADKRVIDLTAQEFADVLVEVFERLSYKEEGNECAKKRFVYGIAGIAQLFGCSRTTANRIKASGKIDKAISQSGRMIAVDADLALQLMKK